MPEYLTKLEEDLRRAGPAGRRRRRVPGRAARRPARALRLVRRRQPDPRDGRGRDGAGPRVHGAHRPLPPADRRQRADAGAAGAAARRRRRAQRGARAVPDPHRHRVRHQRRRQPRPDRRAARPARRRRRQRALRPARRREVDDRADAAPPSPTRTPTSSGTAPAGWSSAAGSATAPRSRGRRASSTPRRCSRACVEFGTAVEINSRPERLDPPKRLLAPGRRARLRVRDRHRRARARASSTGRATAASGRSSAACRSSGSSTPGRPTTCSPGRARADLVPAAMSSGRSAGLFLVPYLLGTRRHGGRHDDHAE